MSEFCLDLPLQALALTALPKNHLQSLDLLYSAATIASLVRFALLSCSPRVALSVLSVLITAGLAFSVFSDALDS